MLNIKNLHVEVNGKEILNEININLEKGKLYVLKGKNGSGKSTLANAIMGNPKCKIVNGKIFLEREDITNLSVSERAKKGLFMSFQSPPEVPGVPVNVFLRQAHNSLSENKKSFLEFQNLIEKEANLLDLNKNLPSRYLNDGFSGGEKKLIEVLQMSILNQKIVILDEVDSGLDKEYLKKIFGKIKSFMDKEKTILVITHYDEMIKSLKPDKIFTMKNGKISEN